VAGFSLSRAAMHLAETRGIPELRAEISAELDVLFVEENVARESIDIEIRSDRILTHAPRPFVGLKHLEQIGLILVGLCSFDASAVEGQLHSFDGHAACDRRIGVFHPAVERVFDRSGENLAVRHVGPTGRIHEVAALDGKRQVNVGSAHHNLTLICQEVDGFLLPGRCTVPIGNRIVFLGMDRAEDEIFIFLQTHPGILGIGIGRVKRGDPFEHALCTAPHLRFGNRADGLAASLGLRRIEIGHRARICRRVDPDAAFELIVGDLVERWNKIKLCIVRVGQVQIVLDERHHPREADHRMRNPAFFQDLNI